MTYCNLRPLSGLFFILATFAVVSGAFANESLSKADAQAAKTFITALGDTAIGTLTEANISDAQREERFKSLVEANFNTPLIARFVLGRHWRTASEDERTEFQNLFKKFMITTYANRFKDYSGEEFIVESASVKRRDIWIDSRIQRHIAGAPPVRIRWRVRPAGPSFKIIDVVVEGISMSITQRDEFAAVIQSNGGTVHSLNEQLKKRITR